MSRSGGTATCSPVTLTPPSDGSRAGAQGGPRLGSSRSSPDVSPIEASDHRNRRRESPISEIRRYHGGHQIRVGRAVGGTPGSRPPPPKPRSSTGTGASAALPAGCALGGLVQSVELRAQELADGVPGHAIDEHHRPRDHVRRQSLGAGRWISTSVAVAPRARTTYAATTVSPFGAGAPATAASAMAG